MFTGLIQCIGRIGGSRSLQGDLRLDVAADADFLAGVAIGDSIAVDGVCLTVVRLRANGFIADVSRESLAATTLGGLEKGQAVNLEKSLTPSSPIGGHFVSGHVDGVGTLVSRQSDARSTRMRFEIPTGLERLVAVKGSIAIAGVSLTVNRVEGRMVDVNIVPHTAQQTTLGTCEPGAAVNIEVDLLARYVARLAIPPATDS